MRAFAPVAAQLLTQELFLTLGREVCARATGPHEAALRAVRVKIYAHPQLHWTIAKMARLAGLKPSRFSSLYRAQFKTSPMDDCIRARVERAKALLRDYDLPVGEVASLCGFTNPYYFSRCFKKLEGVAPSRFR